MRVSSACLSLLGLVFLSGCGDRYPESMTFPLRSERIVVKALPTQQPTHLDPPGNFDTLMDHLAETYKEAGTSDALLNPADLKPATREALQKALNNTFGTPANPKVEGLDPEMVTDLKLDAKKDLERGSQLYRRHCLHCHGLTGNGQGPTGPWVNPHPRDYRLGKFKFSSSSQPTGVRKPRREDLLRTLRNGAEGTSMPSFGLLSDEDLNHLVSAVMHLSIRGQVEVLTIRAILEEKTLEDSGIAEFVKSSVGEVAEAWKAAEDKLITPPTTGVKLAAGQGEAYKESVKRGYDLFNSKCQGCHTEFGRKERLFWDEWGTIVRPANLTAGVYRGGRRPIDLYWRIQGGIAGAPMQAFEGSLSPDQTWDIINFLQVLPYSDKRKEYHIELDAKSPDELTLKHP